MRDACLLPGREEEDDDGDDDDIDDDEIKSIWVRNTIPMCMNQYERCMSTTR